MADAKSGKGGGKQGGGRDAGSRKKAAGKASNRVSSAGPAHKKVAVKAAAKKGAAPPQKSAAKATAETSVRKNAGQKASLPRPVRAAAARAKLSLLPPLPPPLTAQPKKLSRSPARRAICTSTAAQKNAGQTGSIEPLSESELREKLRLASTYVDSWLSRRTLFAAEVTAPEDAWAQVWLWLKRAAVLDDGRVLTQELFEAIYTDEIASAR